MLEQSYQSIYKNQVSLNAVSIANYAALQKQFMEYDRDYAI